MEKESFKNRKRIALVGGGPSALFMYKRLIEQNTGNLEIHIFEKKSNLGAGMPYSDVGANVEHVTNVSDNEIPIIVTSIADWIKTIPNEMLNRFSVDPNNFNEFKVVPRLLFGYYLESQFNLLQELALKEGIHTKVYYNFDVTDIDQDDTSGKISVSGAMQLVADFDYAVMCTGHFWPTKYEGKIPNYFDSPYPPSKLNMQCNFPIAIKGSSLTAIDAIRTLARNNGTFIEDDNGSINYELDSQSPDFRIMLHSRNGMLPAVRFHLDDSHLNNDSLLSEAEIAAHIKENDGFLSLDYIFTNDFKNIFLEKDPAFYSRIKNFSIEEFVEDMMRLRLDLEPFQLLQAEYREAEKSIRRHESIYWKEMLAVLSFAMNHPAKHLSAEDMLRLQKVLLPLISIVIAFVPQSSCQEMLALHNSGVLEIVAVGEDSSVEPIKSGGAVYNYTDEYGNANNIFYKMYIDCVGQPHLSYEDFPFKSLVKKHKITPAQIKFKSVARGEDELKNGNKLVSKVDSENYYLNVSGIAINDNFQILDPNGAYNANFFIMAVPYIGGFNPDYSGLDFCEAASLKIVQRMITKNN